MTEPRESDGTDVLVPLVSEPNGEAGDFTTRCSGCQEIRDVPHTWKVCEERMWSLAKVGIEAEIERPEIIRALNAVTGNLLIARELLSEQLRLKPLGAVKAHRHQKAWEFQVTKFLKSL